jgi:hypothetical protein
MQLSLPQITFLQRLWTDKPAKRTESPTSLFFVEHYRLGARLGRSVEYTHADFEIARQLLISNELPLSRPEGKLRRAETDSYPGISEKGLGTNPHHESVALKVACGTCLCGGNPLVTPPGSYLVTSLNTALNITADRLLVVENLETFRNLERQKWICYNDLNVLAIYRGDSIFGNNHVTHVLERRQEPVWAFYDFDPAGLAMANSLERLERLIYPDIDWLITNARRLRRTDLFTTQEKQYRRVLDQSTNVQIQKFWKAMLGVRGGLPQEWMEKATHSA